LVFSWIEIRVECWSHRSWPFVRPKRESTNNKGSDFYIS
jgi:hypothetical protein